MNPSDTTERNERLLDAVERAKRVTNRRPRAERGEPLPRPVAA